MQKLFIIVTPTYNRAGFLPRLYHSICTQSEKDFVWLIVDDGSNDDTPSVVEGFMAERLIEIRYLRQENQGKHRALQTASRNISEEEFRWWVCVDSDDALTPDALEVFRRNWEEIESSSLNIGIINARTRLSDGLPRGDAFFGDKDKIDGNYVDISLKKNLAAYGDLISSIQVSRLEEMLPIPDKFWLSDKVKFYAEQNIWLSASFKADFRYLKNVLLIVYKDAPNEVSANKRKNGNTSHLYNYIVGYRYFLPRAHRFLTPGRVIKDVLYYGIMCRLVAIRPAEAFNQLDTAGLKAIWLLTIPVQILGAKVWKLRNH